MHLDIQNLDPHDLYSRAKEYYSDFMSKWQAMSATQKSAHVFGNGRTCMMSRVDQSSPYIKNLSNTPTAVEAIELAQKILYGDLEYAFHDQDNDGISMGEYAKGLINTMNNGNTLYNGNTLNNDKP